MILDSLVAPFANNAFMLNALLAGILVSIACGIVGTFVVLRGLAFIGDALAHGVLPGVAVAMLLGLPGMLGAAVIRHPTPQPIPSVIRGTLQAENGKGQRLHRGSIRGWHSFRTSFVTRALAGGMPEELVRRVTGHTAVDIVRKHYFKPGREDFRREFEKAMPRMLMNGAKSRDEQLKEIIEGMPAKTMKMKADKARALGLLANT